MIPTALTFWCVYWNILFYIVSLGSFPSSLLLTRTMRLLGRLDQFPTVLPFHGIISTGRTWMVLLCVNIHCFTFDILWLFLFWCVYGALYLPSPSTWQCQGFLSAAFLSFLRHGYPWSNNPQISQTVPFFIPCFESDPSFATLSGGTENRRNQAFLPRLQQLRQTYLHIWIHEGTSKIKAISSES